MATNGLDVWLEKRKNRIEDVEAKIRNVVGLFNELVLPRVLDHVSAQQLQSLSGNLVQYHRALRERAVMFISAGFSAHYWGVIDAIGFFEDATTDYWKYMTFDGRDQSLVFVEQSLKGSNLV